MVGRLGASKSASRWWRRRRRTERSDDRSGPTLHRGGRASDAGLSRSRGDGGQGDPARRRGRGGGRATHRLPGGLHRRVSLLALGPRPDEEPGLEQKAFAALWRESIDVPGPETEQLGEAARAAASCVVIGVNERESAFGRGTLYNTLLTFGPDGRLRRPPPQARADLPRADGLGTGRWQHAGGTGDAAAVASAR